MALINLPRQTTKPPKLCHRPEANVSDIPKALAFDARRPKRDGRCRCSKSALDLSETSRRRRPAPSPFNTNSIDETTKLFPDRTICSSNGRTKCTKVQSFLLALGTDYRKYGFGIDRRHSDVALIDKTLGSVVPELAAVLAGAAAAGRRGGAVIVPRLAAVDPPCRAT